MGCAQEGDRASALAEAVGPCSRRQFLKLSGISVIGISALAPALARGSAAPLVIVEQARGMVLADPYKCLGCGRCELACTEFNDGKAAPSMARIKVDRNLNFGVKSLFEVREGHGNWGDGLVVQDFCKQCPHPVPCATACPENAMVAAPPLYARAVDMEKCTGCKLCLQACPWQMISFDPDSRKATKCFLCKGKPKCVEACPAEALSYVAWRDMTRKVPPRIATTALPPPGEAARCGECHLPGAGTTLRRGSSKYAAGAGRGGSSASGVIDRAATVLFPVVALCAMVHGVIRAVKKR